MARRVALAAGAFTVAAALAACAGAPAQDPPQASPMSSASPSADEARQYPGPLDGVVDEDSGETIDPQPSPTWDDAQRIEAEDRAAAAMSAFVGTGGREQDAWWARLEPLLTQQARSDYAYVDPANVPATQVLTEPEPQLVAETSGFVAVVDVATDVGTYQVVLTRADSASPWLASRFTPPEEAN